MYIYYGKSVRLVDDHCLINLTVGCAVQTGREHEANTVKCIFAQVTSSKTKVTPRCNINLSLELVLLLNDINIEKGKRNRRLDCVDEKKYTLKHFTELKVPTNYSSWQQYETIFFLVSWDCIGRGLLVVERRQELATQSSTNGHGERTERRIIFSRFPRKICCMVVES